MMVFRTHVSVSESSQKEREVSMKIRLAKKIMSCDNWWSKRFWYNMNNKELHSMDHRITKAIKLKKCSDSRKARNEAKKLLKANPFKVRDLKRGAEQLKKYSL